MSIVKRFFKPFNVVGWIKSKEFDELSPVQKAVSFPALVPASIMWWCYYMWRDA